MTFDLEEALRMWRQRVNRHPGIEPGVAEELELHLRDTIDAERAAGADDATAFQRALSKGFDDLDTLGRDLHRAAASSSRPATWDTSGNRLALLPSYFRTAYRKLARRRGYAAMNIAGLAIAMTCAFLVLLFIVDERGYDTFHPNADHLYRVAATTVGPDGETTVSRTPGPLAPLLDDVETRVESSIRFIDLGRQFIRHDDEGLYLEGVHYVDSSFFGIFGFRLTGGNPETVLRKPNATVITSSVAKRFFGDADPMGQVLTLGLGGQDRDFTIEGIAEDPPRHSHLRFDMLLPFSYWDNLPPAQRTGFNNWVMNWKNNRVITYLRLEPSTAAATFEAELPTLIGQYVDPAEAERVRYSLEAVPDIYLHSAQENELGGPSGDIRYVYLLATIGIMLLLIAGINFVNLTTAHAGERARETGVRKVLGAQRGQLIGQYLGESLVIALLAAVVAAICIALLLPVFGNLVDKPLTVGLNGAWSLWLLLPALALLVGLTAGLYPALVLSKFPPAQALKSTGGTQTRSSTWLRHLLVVSQFTAATVLFAGTLIVNQQLDLFQNKKLGYSKEQVVLIPIDGSDMGDQTITLKERLTMLPEVQSGTVVSYVPGQSRGEQSSAYPFRTAGMAASADPLMWELMPVDHDFLETMDIALAEGRFFSLDFPADSTTAFVINQAAVRAMGWEDPVGQQLDWYMPGSNGFSLQHAGTVIGVVEDFHTYSLHETIRPTVMVLPVMGWFKSYLALKIAPTNPQQTLNALEQEWASVLPGTPFEYTFLDDTYSRLYSVEQTTGRVFSIMTALALFVACLGLIGLSSFIAHQRTKEIGIRKTLGAQTHEILGRLMRSFLGLVSIGVVLAIPITWMGMSEWLDRFAYRIAISPGIFVGVALVSLAIAALVVSFHTVRAARANPVQSLRSE